MQLVEVKSAKDIRDFHALPFRIYRDHPAWIPHLRQDVEKVFNREKNNFWKHGKAIRWILRDDKGTIIGRVAAFVNERQAHTFQQPTGGMGFFECIEDKEAAFRLFDACKEWLQAQGMEAMDGPINFGEKDKFWGLIIKNFEAPPYYGQNFNPEYYVSFFEEYGFQVYYNQLVFHRNFQEKLQPRFVERAERLEKSGDYSIRTVDPKNLEKFAEDFRTIYNRAWTTHDNFKPMKREQAFLLMKQFKPILDVNLIYFAYHKEQPVAFYLSMPELNQVFRYVNGNLNLWGKLKFYWYFKIRKVVDTSFGVAFGIDPDYQGKGVEGLMYYHMEKILHHPSRIDRYKDLIITWIGDFNPKMIRIIQFLGASEFRRLATFRILFDPNAPFERAPIITAKEQKTPR
ncbi:MAG: hypothetical protein F6K11_10970 [Leptolyngbya sp. SIO3F4]|nr:hypothetical protein [Leptolyngbya sp. SIO3F4]